MGRYDKGPFGTILGGVNVSIVGMVAYAWELALIMIYGLGIALDWETKWLDASLLWAGGPFWLLVAGIGFGTLKKWSKTNKSEEDLKVVRTRRAELVHFLHTGIYQTLLGSFWLAFVIHWSATPPFTYDATPLLWSIKTGFRAASVAALLTSFSRVFDTNLVKWSMFNPSNRYSQVNA